MQENETNDLVEEVGEIECPEVCTPEMPRENGVVRLLHTLAVGIFIFGGILGLVAFWQTGAQAQLLMAVMTMLSTWITYGIYGSLVLGVSELLRLLERIADKKKIA